MFMPAGDKMRACITIGGRIIVVIGILFCLAYICLIAAVCVTLKRATQQIEQAYPLTDGNQRPYRQR